MKGWSVKKLTLILCPFGAGAAAVNLFMAGLFAPLLGLPTLPPAWAAAGGLVIGLPATWFFARHIRRLMVRGDG